MKRFDLKALCIGYMGLFFSSFVLVLSTFVLLKATGLEEWHNDYEDLIVLALFALCMIIGGYYAQRHTREGVIWNQALILGLILFTLRFSQSIISIGDPESYPFFVSFLIDLCLIAPPYIGGKFAKIEKRWYGKRV
ncbi:hypothetical protein PAECIP111893_01517 [Paenibacillus plantiphilus]|uniref:DUF4345 domain-containing protein n=1 Tax=Paenibacillus plantiphilus TaxID=2905650 RepID=A0ABM9C184_9BACL|nr:hypothetical protein [Paenibacillus plantiphilus]CAH1200639.1 hypothetical protein PAECIP111893_01517 [Paenibacillus plantiphilus]